MEELAFALLSTGISSEVMFLISSTLLERNLMLPLYGVENVQSEMMSTWLKSSIFDVSLFYQTAASRTLMSFGTISTLLRGISSSPKLTATEAWLSPRKYSCLLA